MGLFTTLLWRYSPVALISHLHIDAHGRATHAFTRLQMYSQTTPSCGFVLTRRKLVLFRGVSLGRLLCVFARAHDLCGLYVSLRNLVLLADLPLAAAVNWQ
jgi:hypothetical protein